MTDAVYLSSTPMPVPMDVLASYEARLHGEGKSQRTKEEYGRIARRLLERHPEFRLITEDDALTFRDDLARTCEPTGMGMYTAALNSFFLFAQLPIHLKPPKAIRKRIKPLSDDEVTALMRAAAADPRPYYATRNTAVMYILLEGALRRSEAANALVEDLDLGTGQLIIRAPKGKHDRSVFLVPDACRAIADYLAARRPLTPEDGRLIFLSQEGKRLHDTGIREIVRHVAHAAGLTRRIWPHLFRHTKLTQLNKRKVDPFLIRDFAGHESIKTLEHYVYTDDEEVRAAVMSRPLVAKDDGTGDRDLVRKLTERLASGEIDAATYALALAAISPEKGKNGGGA